MQPSVEQSYSAFRLEWPGTRDKLLETRWNVGELLFGTQSVSKGPFLWAVHVPVPVPVPVPGPC